MPWNDVIFPFFGMLLVLSSEDLLNLLVFFVKFDELAVTKIDGADAVAELDGAEAVGEKILGSRGVSCNCNGWPNCYFAILIIGLVISNHNFCTYIKISNERWNCNTSFFLKINIDL